MRERIRINSKPVSKDLFARYFFDLWDRLSAEKHRSPEHDDSAVAPGTRPTYARFLTLMSWHLFIAEGVDAAVYETGIGGEYDATNLVEQPVATGITTLGLDHFFALGNTAESIAWHKAGIMKRGSPAFTISQLNPAAGVLQSRAEEKQVNLQTLPTDRRLEAANVDLHPSTEYNRRNATLAVALAEVALRKLGVLEAEPAAKDLPREFVDGLTQTTWRGRSETKEDGDVAWFIDGAHTAESVKTTAAWFAQETRQG